MAGDFIDLPTSKEDFESVGWTFNAGTWVFGEDSGDQGYWNGGIALGEMTYVFQNVRERFQWCPLGCFEKIEFMFFELF